MIEKEKAMRGKTTIRTRYWILLKEDSSVTSYTSKMPMAPL